MGGRGWRTKSEAPANVLSAYRFRIRVHRGFPLVQPRPLGGEFQQAASRVPVFGLVPRVRWMLNVGRASSDICTCHLGVGYSALKVTDLNISFVDSERVNSCVPTARI